MRWTVAFGVTVGALFAACSSSTLPNPDPVDVQAAWACHQFQVFIGRAGQGGTIAADGQAIALRRRAASQWRG